MVQLKGQYVVARNRSKTECGKESLRPALLVQGMFYVKLDCGQCTDAGELVIKTQEKHLRFFRLREECSRLQKPVRDVWQEWAKIKTWKHFCASHMAQCKFILPEWRWPDRSMENTNRGLKFVSSSSIRVRSHQIDLAIGKFKTTQLFLFCSE